MSVTPSWASTVPSTNSTIECTTDCGCTSTSMRSAATPKSQRASMTSSPLFMRVAESIVILRPMFQVGCCRASPGVTSRKRLARTVPERPAGRGEDQPPHLFRTRGRRGTGAARSARCRWAGGGRPSPWPSRPSAPPPSPASPCWRGRRLCPPPGPDRSGTRPDRAHRRRHHHRGLGVGGHGHRSLLPHAQHAGPTRRCAGRAGPAPPRTRRRRPAGGSGPPARPGAPRWPRRRGPRPRSARGTRPRCAGRCTRRSRWSREWKDRASLDLAQKEYRSNANGPGAGPFHRA